MFFTILKEAKSKIVVNRSKFIGLIFYCDNLEKRNEILKAVKSEFFAADHICFAHVFLKNNDLTFYSTDDKEPSGTAGVQILNCLKEKYLVDALCVVVRFFGGVKLGVQNLAKAYKECATYTISLATTKPVELKTKCLIECDYLTYNKLNKILTEKDCKTKFDKNINMEIMLTNEQILKLQTFDLKLTVTGEKNFC